ncbi:unnamed protein product [Psylliodes chrysocephalus]|uniref:ENTH domain-containing protein n=1 Tax=Psylliodes chrysocephalus TaxID=3402493 RepID=A0A9P0D4A2_9CUCU|nr:unnamed protein product [Psylliodes chrysocephala]
MTGRLAGQTINDRLLAAKHSLAGQGLAKSVCKATTEEMIGPKKKHLDYLVHCTNEPNVSIPQLANLLIERSQNTNWVVVYKALVTVHHVMCYGNERFTQYLASSNSTFQLSNFLDKGGVQGYDMSPFVRKYARYLNEKALSYRTVAFDFCKVKRGKDDGMLRTMNADKLLKTVPTLQNQLDALLEFDCSANDLTNGVINMSFMLLFRDLIRLFACYNDGIINLLEKFFDMNKKQCKEALDIYKKFLIRMDYVSEFLKVAENVGIDKGDIPDLTKAPSSLLDALEQHLNYLDGKKSTTSNQSSSASNQKNVKSGVSALSTTSNAFGNVVANARFDSSNGIDEQLKLQLLAEEEAAMNQFKSKVSPIQANNPFLSNSSSSTTVSSQSVSSPQFDLFTVDAASVNPRASDDLLQLSNPFADAFTPQPTSNANSFINQQNNVWMPNRNGFAVLSPGNNPAPSGGTFVNENSFAAVFGNAETKTNNFDPLGGVLQPANANGERPIGIGYSENNNPQPTSNGLLTGDLDSSLASLAENLSINRATVTKSIQWNSPKNGSKTGNNWTPQPISDTTGAGYKPMNQSMPPSPFSSMTIPPAQQPQMYPQIMSMRPMTTPPILTTMPTMNQMNPTVNQMGQQSLLFH